MAYVFLELKLQYNVVLVHSLIISFKNVYLVLMDALVVKIVMIVINVDLIIIFIQQVDYVLKYVVMEKDILLVVMMVIILMEMDVVEIVKYKLDSHVMAVHHKPKIHVHLYCQLKFHSKIEDNQDFMEKL
jgi:hypothetical protein